jgi:hypothetical protein
MGMDRHDDDGLRILGVLAGIGATLPVGFLALLAIGSLPIGSFAGLAIRIPFQFGVLFGGITLALLIATVAVADGQAWGALVIALYATGTALFIYCIDRSAPYATGSDAGVVALHAAVGVLGLTVAYGLARGHPAPSAPVE